MKITIETLRKKKDETDEQRNALRLRLESLEGLVQKLQDDAHSAAVNGEVEKYREISDQIRRTEDEKTVAKVQLESGLPSITKEEAKEAWAAYSSGHDPKEQKALRDLDAARVAYLEAYKKAVDLQEDACRSRQMLASFIGIDPRGDDVAGVFPLGVTIPHVYWDGSSNGEGTIRTGGTTSSDPDLVFYLASMRLNPLQLASDPDARRIESVVRNQKVYS